MTGECSPVYFCILKMNARHQQMLVEQIYRTVSRLLASFQDTNKRTILTLDENTHEMNLHQLPVFGVFRINRHI